MIIGYLVIISDFDINEEDPVAVGDEIEETLKDLGYRHVTVEVRHNHHVDNSAE